MKNIQVEKELYKDLLSDVSTINTYIISKSPVSHLDVFSSGCAPESVLDKAGASLFSY